MKFLLSYFHSTLHYIQKILSFDALSIKNQKLNKNKIKTNSKATIFSILLISLNSFLQFSILPYMSIRLHTPIYHSLKTVFSQLLTNSRISSPKLSMSTSPTSSTSSFCKLTIASSSSSLEISSSIPATPNTPTSFTS